MTKGKILVVEDTPNICKKRVADLEASGYEVFEASNLAEALSIFRVHRVPVVVTDLKMSGGDGLQVAKEIRVLEPLTMVIIITAASRETDAYVRSLKLNVFTYLQKAHDSGEALEGAIDAAFQRHREAAEERRLREMELQTKKTMLAFLTHTMRGTFAGSPAALDTALELSQDFAAEIGRPTAYRAISKLASLRTAFQLIESMLDAYKLLVRDPENLRQAWDEDVDGELLLTDLLNDVLRSAFSRLLFSESQMETFNLLAGGKEERKRIKRSFMGQILLTSQPVSASVWIADTFPILEVREIPQVRLNRSGIRYALLFAVLSEVTFNALKYTDGSKPIQLCGSPLEGGTKLICANSTNRSALSSRGSKKGLDFIFSILEPIPNLSLSLGLPESEGEDCRKLFIATLNIPLTT